MMPASLEKTTSASAPSSSEFFQAEWQIYRKMVDHNLLHHREAYATLRRVIAETFDRPFSFLDVACGDASASIGALQGSAVSRYHGIDLSLAALELAGAAAATLGCPWSLQEGDFARILSGRTERADLVWIGLSLHHFRRAEKLAIMRDVRRILDRKGCFLIYENAGPDGEDRDDWMHRWDEDQDRWTVYDAVESQMVRAHVHGSDYPETDSTWRALGEEAGFQKVDELYRTPADLFRVYSFVADADR